MIHPDVCLIADAGDFTVRRINSDGTVQTIAGSGIQGYGQGYVAAFGGPATGSLLGSPVQAVADQKGNIYISDDYAGVIYIVTPDGNLNLYAGQVGVYVFGGDNIPATSSSFVQPYGLAVDQSGNLYIADPGDNRIREISTAGIITTFAGNWYSGLLRRRRAGKPGHAEFPSKHRFRLQGRSDHRGRNE